MRRHLCVLTSNISVGSVAASRTGAAAAGAYAANPGQLTKTLQDDAVGRRAGVSLRIVVAVKYVPDATGDRHFAEDLTTDRDAVDGLLSELDEYAVEQALQIADAADDAEITVLTVGPEDAKDALRKALSMGAHKAIHVEDEALHGTDIMGTSLVLAKAI